MYGVPIPYPYFGPMALPRHPVFPPYPLPARECGCCDACGCKPPLQTVTGLEIRTSEELTQVYMDSFSFQLENEAPRAAYPVKIRLRETGYEVYKDGQGCGYGVHNSAAYLTIKPDTETPARSAYTFTAQPTNEGLSLPALAWHNSDGSLKTGKAAPSGVPLAVAYIQNNVLAVDFVQDKSHIITGRPHLVFTDPMVYINALDAQNNRITYGKPFETEYALVGTQA